MGYLDDTNGSNSPLDPTLDEAVELPLILSYVKEAPATITKWLSLNLQRMVNNPTMNEYDVKKAMQALTDLYDLIEVWEKTGQLHPKSVDLKSLRYWWRLFTHLYGDKK